MVLMAGGADEKSLSVIERYEGRASAVATSWSTRKIALLQIPEVLHTCVAASAEGRSATVVTEEVLQRTHSTSHETHCPVATRAPPLLSEPDKACDALLLAASESTAPTEPPNGDPRLLPSSSRAF